MSLEDARVRAKQLNAREKLKRQEKLFHKMRKKEKEISLSHDTILPREFVEEFELRFFRKRDRGSKNEHKRSRSAEVTWRAAQKMIVSLQIEPSDWFYHTFEIYDYLFQKCYSIKYAQGILKIANLWGFFICKKLSRPFLPIGMPRGEERRRLIEAYYSKESGVRRPSKSLTTDHLKKAEECMNEANWNWLYLSVWFGLRPLEIDNLKKLIIGEWR